MKVYGRKNINQFSVSLITVFGFSLVFTENSTLPVVLCCFMILKIAMHIVEAIFPNISFINISELSVVNVLYKFMIYSFSLLVKPFPRTSFFIGDRKLEGSRKLFSSVFNWTHLKLIILQMNSYHDKGKTQTL